MRRGDGRAVLTGPAALLALAAVWLCAPSALRASCGDYVIVTGASAGHHADGPTTPALPAPREPSRQPPCHGPMCSRSSLPVLPPVMVSPTVLDQGADLPGFVIPRGPDRIVWFTVPDLRGLPGGALPVYHPPRAAAAITSRS